MNVTFVIGNGFDKAFGLETGYGDFYKWYIEQPSPNDLIYVFKKVIEKNQNDTWADFEIGLGKFSKEFDLETIDDFFQCYQDAHRNLMVYLGEQEKLITINENNLKIFVNSLLHFEQELTPAEINSVKNIKSMYSASDTKFNFLCLNYTYLIDNIITSAQQTYGTFHSWIYQSTKFHSRIGSLVHAHGYSDKWPILAVDNESQVNQDLIDNPYFKRIMIKSDAVSTVGEMWTQNASQIISSSNIICIFGTSIGETDARWWKQIASWLMAENKILIIFYYDEKMTKNTISIYDKMVNENIIKNKFLSFAKESDRDKLRNKIYVIVNTNSVFSFEKLNDKS